MNDGESSKPTTAHDPGHSQRVAGCLLGGAVGDALGAPIEFMRLSEIRERFGPQGLREFAPAYGRLGAITDDTQMTLFTAEGLLRAMTRGYARGLNHPPGSVFSVCRDKRVITSEADCGSSAGGEPRGDGHQIVQSQRLIDRCQAVKAVGAHGTDIQTKIDL